MNTEHKPELPAEVREAIFQAYQNWFNSTDRIPIQEYVCAALAPLWPKQPAPTADARQVAKQICDLAEIVRRDGGEWIALDVEKVAAVLAGYTKQPATPPMPQEDTKRLDWLATQCYLPKDHPNEGVMVLVCEKSAPFGSFTMNDEHDAIALRSAIDAARKEGGK